MSIPPSWDRSLARAIIHESRGRAPIEVRFDVAPFPAAEKVELPQPGSPRQAPAWLTMVVQYVGIVIAAVVALALGLPLGVACAAVLVTAIVLALTLWGGWCGLKALWRLGKRFCAAARDGLYLPKAPPEYDPHASWQARMGAGETQVRQVREDAASLGRREVHLLIFTVGMCLGLVGLVAPVAAVVWS